MSGSSRRWEIAIVSGELPPGRRLTLEDLQQRLQRVPHRGPGHHEGPRIHEPGVLTPAGGHRGAGTRTCGTFSTPSWCGGGSPRSRRARSSTAASRNCASPSNPSPRRGLPAARAPRSAARLVALAAELRRLGEAGDLEAFLKADIEFHRLLLHSCGNEMFKATGGDGGRGPDQPHQAGMMPSGRRPQMDRPARDRSGAGTVAAGRDRIGGRKTGHISAR